MNPEIIKQNDANSNNGEEWQHMEDDSQNSGERREAIGEVEIRFLNPEADNLEKAADLIYQVDPYICPDFFGDRERAKEMGKVLFSEEGGLFDPNHTLVAEEDGQLLGILVFADNTIKPWDTEKFLSMPQYHEQHLTVLADNPVAIHVYEKMGFEIVSSQTGYPDESVKTHSMIRKAEV